MVPLGKHAFFPGQLTHTNELIVHLGDQYHVKTTAAAARAILQRKLAVIADGVQKAEKQLQSLQARLGVAQSSLRDDTGDGNAMEIRSSLEESDALLASAGSSRHKQQQQQQTLLRGSGRSQKQQQQPVSRVTTSAGYSYTPVGMPQTPQQQQHQGLDYADVALQARLAELMRLEEQQEIEELEQHQLQQPHHPDQHQQQLDHGSLATIDEGDEEQEDVEGDEEQEDGQAAAPSLGAAQRLQQLEAEADSDDEEDSTGQCSMGQQQQQKQQRQHLQQPVGVVLERLHDSMVQQQATRGTQPAAVSSPAAAQVPPRAAAGAKKPLKSALKKGFLTAAGPKAQPASAFDSGKVDSHSTTAMQKPRGPSSPAFTGAVVERPSTTEQAEVDSTQLVTSPVGSVGAVMERPVAPVSMQSSAAADSSGSGRVSRFMLRRKGLEAATE